MSDSIACKRVRRFFWKRRVRQQLARVSASRKARGWRRALPEVFETVLGAWVLQIRSSHRLVERTRTGPPLQVAALRLTPLPDATLHLT
jgi:hypothetical protein